MGSRQSCVWGWAAPCRNARTVFGEKAVGGGGWGDGTKPGRTTQQGLQVSLQMRFDAHGRCLKDLAHVSKDYH